MDQLKSSIQGPNSEQGMSQFIFTFTSLQSPAVGWRLEIAVKLVCEGDRAFSEASAVNALPQALNLNRNLISLYPKRKTRFLDVAMIYANNCKTVNIAVCIFASSAPTDLVLGAAGPTPAVESGIGPSPGPDHLQRVRSGAAAWERHRREISRLEKQSCQEGTIWMM